MGDNQFHLEMMSRAIQLSKKAVDDPTIYEPFGAVVVRNPDRKILGEGCNNMREMSDPSLHGEVVAIKAACKAVGSLELVGCTLYTSCEPCTMCASLIWLTNIEQVYYGNSENWHLVHDLKGQTKTVSTPTEQRPNYKQLMPDEAADVIKEWAEKERKLNK